MESALVARYEVYKELRNVGEDTKIKYSDLED